MRALFLQSNIDDAHQYKVIRLFALAGWETVRCGFRRSSYYRGEQNSDVTILGEQRHNSTVARVPAMASALSRVRRLSKDCDIAFSFGADMHLMVALAHTGPRPVFVREVADIPKVLSGKGASTILARNLERWSLRNLDALVVTSAPFVDDFYRRVLGAEVSDWFLVENKLLPADVGPRPKPMRIERSGVIRIGYFGLLRCRRSLELLAMLADKHPHRFEIVIRGHNISGYPLLDSPRVLPNFRYGGPFRSPQDLGQIYSSCDLVWSCYPYDPSNINAKLAQTNRFYEACYFRRPQVCQIGTQDARKVEELGIGLLVDMATPHDCIQRLANLDSAQLSAMTENINHLPDSLFCYAGEVAPIVAFCSKLARAHALRI